MRSRATGALGSLLLLLLSLLAACGSAPLTQPSWPAPPDPMAQAEQAGIAMEAEEHLTTHTHVHLDVFVDGERVEVPSGIGIDIEVSGVSHELSADGTAHEYFVSRCDALCLSDLHTHDPSGIIHTESRMADQEPYTLGQFFTEWGVRLDASCVGEFCKGGAENNDPNAAEASIAVYVNGEQQTGNPSDIKLVNHVEIAIVIGSPPDEIPSSFTFLEGM
jgi:hypothetical protein